MIVQPICDKIWTNCAFHHDIWHTLRAHKILTDVPTITHRSFVFSRTNEEL